MINRLKNHHDSAPANSGETGAMQGFDAEFVDIVDYILRITYRIWEGKQIGLCYDYYSDDCPVYTLGGYVQGSEQVVQNTLNTLAAFPDRVLEADNIIWGGDDQDGFHTSHLINTSMTNEGDSEFGPASGKKATIKVIAHCVIKDNKIIKEWLVRDNYSLAEQLGFNPHDIAKKFASTDQSPEFLEWYQSELARVSSYSKLAKAELPETDDPEQLVLTSLQNIWNARMVGDVFQAYGANATVHASANRELKGHQAIIQFYLSFLGTFSELKVALDYSCQQPHKESGTDVAVRWTMVGKHTGGKLFGLPSNAPILIIGESQYQVVDGKIIEEWTVFDQLSVLTQIHRARNAIALKDGE